MDKQKLEKFIEACSSGATVKEACLYAEVPDADFIEHCRLNVGFVDYCTSLMQKPEIDSLISLAKGVQTDPELALKLLKCKRRDVYSERSEHTGAGGSALKLISID